MKVRPFSYWYFPTHESTVVRRFLISCPVATRGFQKSNVRGPGLVCIGMPPTRSVSSSLCVGWTRLLIQQRFDVFRRPRCTRQVDITG